MSALERGAAAASKLLVDDFAAVQSLGTMSAYNAHVEIETLPAPRKSAVLYRGLALWRRDLVRILGEGYRRYVRLTLGHAVTISRDPTEEAWLWLQPAIQAGIAEMRQWIMLACDGENDTVRHIGTVALVPNETVRMSIPTALQPPLLSSTWRVPSWVFWAYTPATGIGPLKMEHVPNPGTEDKLSDAFTKLIFCGARRLFLLELRRASEHVRDEEIAAISASPSLIQVSAPRRSGLIFNNREQKILDVINAGARGRKYAIALDAAGLRPRRDWREKGCPSTYRDAYWVQTWRKRIWDEKTKLEVRAKKSRD